MNRKYHTHKLQANPWDREEESHNNKETQGRQAKQSNQFSLPHQDDCETRRDIKKRTAKHRTITESHYGSNNKTSRQQQNISVKITIMNTFLNLFWLCLAHDILNHSSAVILMYRLKRVPGDFRYCHTFCTTML